MSIFVRARFDAREGHEAEFEKAALALRERAEDEPGTLTYRVFAIGPGSLLMLEEYSDSDAALAHNEHCADLLDRVGRCADMAYAEVYGEIAAAVRAWADGQPNVTLFADVPDAGRDEK